MNSKILIVEDEARLREVLGDYFASKGDFPFQASNGAQALRLLEEQSFDAVLLDIMMPGLDGLSVCRAIRKSNDVPVIFLTALSDEDDKLLGYELGADDYVTKPFSPSELVARVDAVYRRVALASDRKDGGDELVSGEFTLNLRNRSFLKGKRPIELTQVEFQIMEYFFSHPGVALARGDILKHVWGAGYTGEEKIVDVNIRRLRMKVEEEPSNPQHIITVWGLGYRWDE